MRPDDFVLVQKRQLAAHLEHSLDHEHHIGAAGIVLVEDEARSEIEVRGSIP